MGLDDFTQALSAPQQPQAVLAALEDLVMQVLPVRLYTVMTFDRDKGEAARIWTNSAAYPLKGRKPVEPNDWTAQVLDRHQPFIANTPDEIAAVFPDHALIATLGCGACLNLPVVVGDEVLGTLNLLDREGYFTASRLSAAQALRLPAAAALMVARGDHSRSSAGKP